MKYFKISFGIFLVLSATRFIPHPPNFTSLLALSFYVPAIFGIKYILPVILSFFLTDTLIGFHNLVFFTWGSVILIGLISKYFFKTIFLRLIGTVLSSILFYIITNYGVWLMGVYEFSINGLIQSYILAIPFFKYTLLSTLMFSFIIECIIKLLKIKKLSYST
tara:strand:+ start:57 stop:545 length:489 start_codon:yes stop_codon:yes gene_type:complete